MISEKEQAELKKYLIYELSKLSFEEKYFLKNKVIYKNPFKKDKFTLDYKQILLDNSLIGCHKHSRFFDYPKHKHNYIEFNYIIQGKMEQNINDNNIVLNQGDLLFLNQNIEHEIFASTKNDLVINFTIHPKFFRYLFEYTEQSSYLQNFLFDSLYKTYKRKGLIFRNAKNKIEDIILILIYEIQKNNSFSDLKVKLYMGLLFIELMEAIPEVIEVKQSHNHKNKLVLQVLKYIDNEYKEGSLDEISKRLKQKNYTITRVLKKKTGYNFNKLLKNKRLQIAEELLKKSKLSIEQISQGIGYKDTSHFYKIFKKKYNCTPKEYSYNNQSQTTN